jgi:hypothetical protein
MFDRRSVIGSSKADGPNEAAVSVNSEHLTCERCCADTESATKTRVSRIRQWLFLPCDGTFVATAVLPNHGTGTRIRVGHDIVAQGS